jgi:AmiR/NasT family two-component response regulator
MGDGDRSPVAPYCSAPQRRPRPSERVLRPDEPLRVLIANERLDRLELLAQLIRGLGHDVIAREIHVREVGAVTARERPDVALVGLGLSYEHALGLISEIVRDSSCPVIALLSAGDPGYVRQAARRGVFAYIVHEDLEQLQSAIDITLARFAEYQSLKGAFGRRAVIEQAKGSLMARHSIDGDQAWSMLVERSRLSGSKLIELAQAVVDSHLLLVPLDSSSPPAPPETGA